MNDSLINNILKSNDISKYINTLAVIFSDIGTIENIFKEYRLYEFLYSLFDDDEYTRIEELELYASVNNIKEFLKKINDINYNIDIIVFPEFQYIKKMIFKLESVLLELLILDKKTKTKFIKLVGCDDGFIFGHYSKFCSELNFDTKINLSNYKNLNYTILTNLIKLKETTKYAACMFNLLKHSFNCYSLYHSIFIVDSITKNNNFHGFKSIHEFKNYVIRKLCNFNIILHNFWLNYIDANKITIFLQSLIQDTECMIMKSTQLSTDINIAKLNNTIFVLLVLIQSYQDNIDNKLSIIVDYLKIQQFLSAICEHINI